MTSDATSRAERPSASKPTPVSVGLKGNPCSRVKIWIDLDNTPHVPLFKPVIRELRHRGHRIITTARDAFQVRELAALLQVPTNLIGNHNGKSKVMKVAGLFIRAFQLAPSAIAEQPGLAVSHGSRAQLLISKILGIKTLLLTDYEHASWSPLWKPDWTMLPAAIRSEAVPMPADRVCHYDGIKEDMYVPDFRPDPKICTELLLHPDKVIVTVRPPANEAHYHNKKSDMLLVALMERLTSNDTVQIVLLPRNKRQQNQLKAASPHWFESRKTIVPEKAVDGLNLLWFSDAVVSGGGTINREAAALGVPVYSIFCGTPASVDLWLEKQNRLSILRTLNDVETRIRIEKRDKTFHNNQFSDTRVLNQVVDHIEKVALSEGKDLNACERHGA